MFSGTMLHARYHVFLPLRTHTYISFTLCSQFSRRGIYQTSMLRLTTETSHVGRCAETYKEHFKFPFRLLNIPFKIHSFGHKN